MSLPVAVLAGGLATRLGSITEHTPKILLDVAGRPFAEQQLVLLHRAGVTHVVYCLGHLGHRVVSALGDGKSWGMRFDYVHDGQAPAGTGGALRLALPHLGSAFFVMYGDSFLECDYRDIERVFRASGMDGLMTVYRNEDRHDRSNVQFEHGQIERYDKINRSPAMRHIDYGLGVLTPAAFAPWRDTHRFDLMPVYQRLIEQNRLAGYETPDRFFEIGSPVGLRETRELLEARLKAAQ